MRHTDTAISAFNDRLQNTTDRQHAAMYLSSLDTDALRALCDLNHLEESDNRNKMIRRLVQDRHGREITPVAFTAPRQRRESEGKGQSYTTEKEKAGRIAFLEAIDRRCVAYGSKCLKNRATRLVTAYHLEDGQRVGEPVTLKACTKHVGWFAHTGNYDVIDVQALPPVTDDEKNRIGERLRAERRAAALTNRPTDNPR